jgi:hypothetical protein
MSKMQITTPRGELRWVNITGQGKTNLSGDQIYCADVVLPTETAQPLIDKLEAFWEENKPKGAKEAKSMGYRPANDECTEWAFSFKTKTTYPSGDQKKIKVYNAKVKEIEVPDTVRVGNGSEGCLAGVAAIYIAGKNVGVTLYLDSIQLVKFVEYKGMADGFEEADDGFDNFAEDDNPFKTEDVA